MKLWRKHNSSKYVRSHPHQRIIKSERATFFNAEQSSISTLFLILAHRVGLIYFIPDKDNTVNLKGKFNIEGDKLTLL